jgi:hypothetical protein
MRVVLALLFLSFVHVGQSAATVRISCVGNVLDLTNALATLSNSTSNTDSDEIRIRAGTYFAPAGGWVGSVSNHHDLAVHGGYLDAGCLQQTNDASVTILDGGNAAGVLRIDTPVIPNANIEVSGLTFQNGSVVSSFASVAGGLKISDTGPISGGNILVERNIFRNNVVTGANGASASGGLLAATDGQSLIVRNNLFVNNGAPNSAAAFVFSNNAIDVSNNTFTDNHSTDDALQQRVVMDFFTATGLKLSNNIFWGNAIGPGVFDLNLHGQFRGATLLNNDIEASTGTAVAATGTLSLDPVFVGDGNFRLSSTSSLINAGINNPTGGLTGADLDGAPRIDEGVVDLGAYESSYLFANGFE